MLFRNSLPITPAFETIVMILEQRTYRLKPGKVAEYLTAVETIGLPVMKATLGGFIGYFVTEAGGLNEVVHLWAYEDLDDRARRRKACADHPDWARFIAAATPLFEEMQTRILTPASFTPLTLEVVRGLQRGA